MDTVFNGPSFLHHLFHLLNYSLEKLIADGSVIIEGEVEAVSQRVPYDKVPIPCHLIGSIGEKEA